MMSGLLELALLVALCSAYAVAVLRYDPEATQPTPPWTKRLLQTDEAIYLWSYFDYVRYWLGAYTETTPLDGRPGYRVFVPNERAYGFLSCPKCLSFWCALGFTVFVAFGYALPLVDAVLLQISATCLSWLVVSLYDAI